MIFDEQVARKPDYYPRCQEFIDVMWKGHWTPNEFDFKYDKQQFLTELTDEQRLVIQNTLSAIGQIEIAVKKFWSRLGDNLPHPSINDLGLVMAQVEVVHNKAYEKLLDVLQLQDSFEENLKLPVIKGRVNYLRKYLDKVYGDDRKQYVYALILFTLFVENVSLFSQFYVILWFNRYKNLLKDTAQQVQYTKSEELIHAQVGIWLIQTIREEYPDLFDEDLTRKVYKEAREAYDSEAKIIDWILGDYSEGNLTGPIVKVYVKNRINGSLTQLGMGNVFELSDTEKQLLEETYWMDEELYGNFMTDFFSKKPTEYVKGHTAISAGDLF